MRSVAFPGSELLPLPAQPFRAGDEGGASGNKAKARGGGDVAAGHLHAGASASRPNDCVRPQEQSESCGSKNLDGFPRLGGWVAPGRDACDSRASVLQHPQDCRLLRQSAELPDGCPRRILPRTGHSRLQRQASSAYAAIDPSRQVVPALELIEAVAQDRPTDNGLYLYRMEPDVVDQYTRLATDNHLLLFLDEQIGRSDPSAEVERLLPRLASPAVQLALDPEFTMTPGQVPGDLGSMDAAAINRVQEMLEQVAVQNQLPSKILIVHEFQNDMVTHLEQLRSYPHVDLVLDADGFGTRQMKTEKYSGLIAQ